MSSLASIQSSISSILKQLSTAQKDFGELKDVINSSKEHKSLRNELKDLELLLKAVQRAILQDSLASSDDEMQNLVVSFDASLHEFIQESQAFSTSILSLPHIEVNNFSIKTRTFRKQIIAQFPDNTLAKYQEDLTQTSRSVQADQDSGSINLMGEWEVPEAMEAIKEDWEEEEKVPSSHSTTQTRCILWLSETTWNKSPSDEVKKNDIMDWLTTINFYQRQDTIFETWQEGTGQWFLSLPEFKNWLSNSERVLWCEGPPGAGKTVLSSLVVKHIEDKFQTPKVGLAYIYINHKELGTQTPTALFASLCKQLLVDKPLPSKLQDLWQYHSKRNTQPTLADVLRFSNRQLVPITAEQVDITLYIETQFNHSDNLRQLLENRPELKVDIQLAIVQDVNGMQLNRFLLAKLRIDHLGIQTTVASLQGALTTLPSTLTAAYEVTMARINAQPEACAGLVTVDKELSVVRVVHYTAQNWLESQSPDGHKEIAETSFQYLEFSEFDGLQKLDEEGYSFAAYAQYCIEHTRMTNSEMGLISQVAQFARKAWQWKQLWSSMNWSEQIALWRNGPWPEAKKDFQTLILAAAGNLQTVRAIDTKHYKCALSLAAYAGHSEIVKLLLNIDAVNAGWGVYDAIRGEQTEIVKMLLDAGADMNIAGGEYGTVLHAAVNWRSRHIVKMLLAAGADTNIVGGKYGTALHTAVCRESEPIVKMLLDAGADMNIVGVYWKSRHIVKMLLAAGADTNIVGGKYGTALHTAVYRKSKPIVKVLLDDGADVNIVGGEYGTALQAAAYGESEPIVKTLLDAGADVNIVGGEFGTALQAAAYVESEPIVKMLLDAGADVNIVGGKYGTALQAAAYRESEPIVKMLLDAGADLNIVGGEYGTALQAAACRESEPIAKVLLDAGADLNIVGGRYGTALQAAAYGKSEAILKVLLDAGADVNFVGGEYGTALRAAVAWNAPETESMVKLLLDGGANPNWKGGVYGSALKATKALGLQTIEHMLLEAGADDYDEEAEMEVAVSEMPILNSDEMKSSQIVGLPVIEF
ncbi:ankyrin repeat-containing domain protein [Favolaschia claudopus]|uniref:Ankyrin repeat-containing domain protein n=1 Tax=Favolaschia claudopus TaxID=2862362 RepID=A0AAV9ZDZ9_9AGAR